MAGGFGKNNRASGAGVSGADTGAGQGVRKGSGKSVHKGTGKSVHKGTGKSVHKGTGKSVHKGTGKSVHKGTGMGVHKGTTRGFARTSSLLQTRIRKVSEHRGFAESRLLTHWQEIVGADLASMARPVDVKYGRQGFGATLTVLTTGPQAPMLEMQKEALRARVNAVYGYNAIARVRITQTAPTGFAEGQVSFQHRRVDQAPPAPDAAIVSEVQRCASPVRDDSLRAALENLGRNVLSKAKSKTP